jgi:iron-sulfur cluster repair protein YtfE (RIC family)
MRDSTRWGRSRKFDLNIGSTNSGSSTRPADLSALADSFARHLTLQFDLCSRLEELADALPANILAEECLLLSRSIVPVLRRAHQFEENLLFPVISRALAADISIAATLERLRCEHWEDESYACEVRDCLAGFLDNPHGCNVDSLAYMLRGFFEGLRRHIAFDREHMLPLLSGLPK